MKQWIDTLNHMVLRRIFDREQRLPRSYFVPHRHSPTMIQLTRTHAWNLLSHQRNLEVGRWRFEPATRRYCYCDTQLYKSVFTCITKRQYLRLERVILLLAWATSHNKRANKINLFNTYAILLKSKASKGGMISLVHDFWCCISLLILNALFEIWGEEKHLTNLNPKYWLK